MSKREKKPWVYRFCYPGGPSKTWKFIAVGSVSTEIAREHLAKGATVQRSKDGKTWKEYA